MTFITNLIQVDLQLLTLIDIKSPRSAKFVTS